MHHCADGAQELWPQSAPGLIVVANILMRLGLSSERDRHIEQQARQHLERTGRWEP